MLHYEKQTFLYSYYNFFEIENNNLNIHFIYKSKFYYRLANIIDTLNIYTFFINICDEIFFFLLFLVLLYLFNVNCFTSSY